MDWTDGDSSDMNDNVEGQPQTRRDEMRQALNENKGAKPPSAKSRLAALEAAVSTLLGVVSRMVPEADPQIRARLLALSGAVTRTSTDTGWYDTKTGKRSEVDGT